MKASVNVETGFGLNLSLTKATMEGALGDSELERGAEPALAEARNERVQHAIVRRIATLEPTAADKARCPLNTFTNQSLKAMSRTNMDEPLPLGEKPLGTAVD
eukprot:2565785-Pyramimonas_sp.AAC.1